MPTGAQDIFGEYSAQMTTLLTFILDTFVWSNHSDVTRVLGPQKEAMEGKWDPLFQEYPGWVKILIWPDMYRCTHP